MTISAIQKTSVGRNGVGAFILQCKRLDFHYCDWAGSSKGMNKHPVIRGHFINGAQHAICVRNLAKEQVLQKAEILRDMSGEKATRVKGGRVVGSLNEGIRGVWDPYHGAKAPSFAG
ncbi:MAG: hypothetical protein Q9185_000137 [Variospora sp. 1 TL-2023]